MNNEHNLVCGLLVASLAAVGVACNPPDPDPSNPTNMCVAADPSTATVHDSAVTSPETWSAGAHTITSSITVSAALTIDPCASIQVADGVTVTVSPTGSIVGEGDASHAITISALANGWTAFSANGGTIRFAYTNASGGGLGGAGDQAMFIGHRGSDPNQPVAQLSFDHVTIQGSKSNGVVLRNATFDPASTALTITGSAQYPIDITPMAFDSIPTGAYTGNTNDEILVVAGVGNGVTTDNTMHDRGVPYHIGQDGPSSDLRVGTEATGLATLTIEPNVTLRFEKTGLLTVEHYDTDAPATGALVAIGTADAPIVFTSASANPAAGDWIGVALSSHLDATDKLDHVRLEYAGMLTTTIGGCPLNTAGQAALLIMGYAPAQSILTNSEIVSSGKDGVFREWIGAPVDFTASNTFTDVPHCKQTTPESAQGVCPSQLCE